MRRRRLAGIRAESTFECAQNVHRGPHGEWHRLESGRARDRFRFPNAGRDRHRDLLRVRQRRQAGLVSGDWDLRCGRRRHRHVQWLAVSLLRRATGIFPDAESAGRQGSRFPARERRPRPCNPKRASTGTPQRAGAATRSKCATTWQRSVSITTTPTVHQPGTSWRLTARAAACPPVSIPIRAARN